MNEYELLYIVTARQAADDVSEVIDWVAGVVGDAGGEVLSVNNWGRRRLAYPIDHEFEGNYVFTTLSLSAESTGAVESALTISEDVIRHLLIRGIIPSDGSPPPEFVGERPRTMQAPATAPSPAEPVAEVSEPEASEQAEAPAEGDAEPVPASVEPATDGAPAEATESDEAPAAEAAESVEANDEPAEVGEAAEATEPGEAAPGDEGTEQQPAEPSTAATSSE